ncbi:outer membrane protein [Mesorhizobium sp. A623]
MKLEIRIALALGAAALTPLAPALAADYDPPIYVDQAPEYQPVEVGSGWYLRGDVGYSFGDPVYDFELLGEETKHQRFTGGLGVGYHFDDWLRGDVTLNYLGGDTYDLSNVGSASHTMWSGLVNGYVDLGTYAGLTPYVGGGVGVLFSQHKIDVNAPAVGLIVDYDDKQQKFAYALNAGASYKVSDNVSVDIGYQFLSSPSAEYLDTDSFEIKKGIDLHQVKVGLRYDLW